jgi:PhnB protein
MIYPQLAVQDVDASVAFYTQKLGFKLDFTMPDADGKNTFAWVSLGKAAFGLQFDPTLSQRGNGVVFMVMVDEAFDLDQYYADVQAKGVTIVEPIQDQYWGDRTFTVHDPDGYVLTPAKTTKMVNMEEAIAARQAEKSV